MASVLVVVAAALVILTPAAPAVIGVLAAIGGFATARRHRARAGSRWRRGWWVIAVAAPVIGAGAVPSTAQIGLSTLAGAVGASLVLIGLVGARPVRDAAQTRELLIQAVLAGLVVAYLAGAVASAVGADVGASLLVALAAEVAALMVTAHQLWGDRVTVVDVDRYALASLAVLVTTRFAAFSGSVGGPSLDPSVLAMGTGVGLVFLGLALVNRRVTEQVPVALATGRVLRAGHVLVVVAGVMVGPVVITALADTVDGVLEFAVLGAMLALVAVLHLVQLVRDHGRRAWRARHDALTQLPTEPLFRDRLEQEIMRARRTGRGLAVAFIDLDGFKRVNDRDGHDAGDEVLRTVAVRLQAALREQDTVARKAGDEFLVLLPEVDDPEGAEVVAGKLVAAVCEPVPAGAGVHRIGASVGLALWPRDGASADELIRNADVAMYDVKEEHGGAVRWYTRATTSRTRLRLTLAAQLEQALGDAEQFDVAYQPRVDLRDGRVEGVVALVRWRHRDLGLITPRSFLPIAVEAGLSRTLDLMVLERAAGDLTRWRAEGWMDVPVTVHIADSHVGHPNLEEDVIDVLRRTGLPGDRLQLAVTETGLGRGGEIALRTFRDLAESKVTALVSRFGTGAVSLGMLAAAEIGTVELASEHVAPLSGLTSPVVRAALAVAQQLDLTPVVNGVSTVDQIERLRDAGCRAGRGPHLGPPQLAEELERRLAALSAQAGHEPAAIRAAELRDGSGDAQIERPGIAAVLAAAAGLDDEVEEQQLIDVLTLIGGTTDVYPRLRRIDAGVRLSATGHRGR